MLAQPIGEGARKAREGVEGAMRDVVGKARRVSRSVWRKVCTFEEMLTEKQRMEESCMEESTRPGTAMVTFRFDHTYNMYAHNPTPTLNPWVTLTPDTPAQPIPLPAENPYPLQGSGFGRVRVRLTSATLGLPLSFTSCGEEYKEPDA